VFEEDVNGDGKPHVASTVSVAVSGTVVGGSACARRHGNPPPPRSSKRMNLRIAPPFPACVRAGLVRGQPASPRVYKVLLLGEDHLPFSRACSAQTEQQA